MDFKFTAMNNEYAVQMINEWKYPGEYSVYDYSNEAEELLEESNWGYSRFAVLDDTGGLTGELTVELFRQVPEGSEDDGYVSREKYEKNPCGDYEMWIGFGLRPGLTGKGLGGRLISSCIDFAASHFDYKGEFIRLAVSDFNLRAIKTYNKAGFEVFENIENAEDKSKILWMRKPINKKTR